MSKEEMYRQCTVRKRENDSLLERTFWGPEKHTVVGKIVKIQEDDGSWTDGWKVESVYNERLPERIAKWRSHDYTRHRCASDI